MTTLAPGDRTSWTTDPDDTGTVTHVTPGEIHLHMDDGARGWLPAAADHADITKVEN